MQNTTEFTGDWNETKGKLKQHFVMLTDADLLLEDGKREEMMGRLRAKLGLTKEQMRQFIADL